LHPLPLVSEAQAVDPADDAPRALRAPGRGPADPALPPRPPGARGEGGDVRGEPDGDPRRFVAEHDGPGRGLEEPLRGASRRLGPLAGPAEGTREGLPDIDLPLRVRGEGGPRLFVRADGRAHLD